ncbi:hypothetical protein MMC28_010791 [Mycoblastus sanguinarius]|nr:hypothetical protein [Mycoblastus sanguinarius]
MSLPATKITTLPGFKNIKATPGGKLFDLPRELRDTIYTQLIEARNLDILRASKVPTEEAAEMIKKCGVYRIKTYRPFSNPPQLEIDYYIPFRPISKLPSMIQNVEIRVPC